MLKKPELTVGEMLKRKVVSKRVTRCDEPQQFAIGSLQSGVEYYERQEERAEMRDRANSSGSGSGNCSPRWKEES